jgi:radical SAM protein with 4Fe4S-binding SPASM domain
MLSASVTGGPQPRLNVRFDTPVPPAVQAHPEWSGVWSQITRFKTAEVHGTDGTVTGFGIDLEAWRSWIGGLRPEESRFHDAVFGALSQTAGHEAREGLQVNFHQRPFDTAERFWAFTLNQGYFFDYLINRIYWYLGPQRCVVTPFPLHVDIETANTCNMHCPMCYRDRMKEIGQMDMALFRKAIDECSARSVFSVRLSWRGEPLTHPRITEMIAYATARIKNVSFLTNAFYLDDPIMDCLIDSGVAYVAVSFDGIGEVYERVRHPAKFAESRARLERLIARRRAAGSARPQIRLCTVWPAIKDDPAAYAKAMTPVCDYMVTNPYINFAGPMIIKPHFMCQYPWERIMVAFNGKVQCCTGWDASDIVLGNLVDGTIEGYWVSEHMTQIRRMHAEDRRMELASCAECRHGAAGNPNASMDDILSKRE